MVVSEEAKEGTVGTDGSKGHTTTARGREALLYSCTNFCSLRQTKMSWPLARQHSQRVPLKDREVGHPEFTCRGVVNVAMGGCGDGVAIT